MTEHEEFALRYPEFRDPPPDQAAAGPELVDYWLNEARRFLCKSAWGDNYRRAVLAWTATNLAAHIRRAMNGPANGEAGPVTAAAVGGESVAYGYNNRFADSAYADQWFLLYPPYGPEYLALRDATLPGVQATNT